jgi:protein-S-isoprenylcysteine O-methyltransferase Ste14
MIHYLMNARFSKPWAELIIYVLVFTVVGAGLYLLKRQLKGPQSPTHVPLESPDTLRSTRPR